MLDLGMQLVKGDWSDAMRAARLTALLKGVPDEATGAQAIRPIASGEALRLAVGRAMLKAMDARIEETLLPAHQMSFTTDGCQIIYQLIRRHLAENPGHVCVEGDESSAFQRACRPQMRKELMKSLPEFVPYFHGAYDAPAGLHYAGHVMDPALSCNGAQQGCSWGTLLFGLSRKQDMVDLIAAHPACLILSQSDDIFIVGPPTEVAASATCGARPPPAPNTLTSKLLATPRVAPPAPPWPP